ncbi:MAG TPA: 7-cyano-7-deazaguanine synthase QueC [Ktedonobacterales bacterium]|nr:7-cyano-7-deazaguanine synthase QueC [Ktedonobacterales bacterium]
MSQPKRAVVLLSGGMDSATSAAIARAEGFDLYTLAFDYGQRHRRELASAQAVSQALGARDHRVVTIDLRAFGGSALTDDIAVPHDRTLGEMGHDIPITYVPGRNLIFLSFATAYAEVVGADDIFLGINQQDYSGYPDCRQEFLDSFIETANLATKAGTQDGRRLQIHAPLIALTKGGIVSRGLELGVPFELTWSCYEGDERACGTCDSCQLRLKGFAEAGVTDPIPYANA